MIPTMRDPRPVVTVMDDKCYTDDQQCNTRETVMRPTTEHKHARSVLMPMQIHEPHEFNPFGSVSLLLSSSSLSITSRQPSGVYS